MPNPLMPHPYAPFYIPIMFNFTLHVCGKFSHGEYRCAPSLYTTLSIFLPVILLSIRSKLTGKNQKLNHHRITPGGNITKDNRVLIKLKSVLAKQLINSCEISTCSCVQARLSLKHRWHRAFTKHFIHWIQ